MKIQSFLVFSLLSFALFSQSTRQKNIAKYRSESFILDRLSNYNHSKALSFYQAFTYYDFNPGPSEWYERNRYTDRLDNISTSSTKIKYSTKTESFTNKWFVTDSVYYVIDTSIARYKIPSQIRFIDTLKYYEWDTTLLQWDMVYTEYLSFNNSIVQSYNIIVTPRYLGMQGNLQFLYKREDYVYSQNIINHSLIQTNNYPSSGMSFTDSTTYQFDSNGYPTEYAYYDISQGSAQPLRREILINDSIGNIVDHVYETYFFPNGFRAFSKYKSIYGQNRQVLSDTSFGFNGNQEFKYSHSNYFYTQNRIQNSETFEYVNGQASLTFEDDYYYSNNKIDSVITFSYMSGTKNYYSKDIYQYTPFGTTVGLNNYLKDHSIGFYPNPTSDIIRFEKSLNQKVDIINLSGQTIETLPINIKEFNLSHLENGIYFLKSGSFIQKLVKY